MRAYLFLSLVMLPLQLFSQSFPSFQKVKSDLVSRNILTKNDVNKLEQTEYPWELGIIKLYNRKTQDSVLPDYFNKATRQLTYNLPYTYSINMCKISVIYVKMKQNDSWKYYTTISEGCPKGSINTYNLQEETKKNFVHLQSTFLDSFIKKPSDWAELVNMIGIDSVSFQINEAFGGAKLTYSIEYSVYYSSNGNNSLKKYLSKATLFNQSFTPIGNVQQLSQNTLKELPASLLRVQ